MTASLALAVLLALAVWTRLLFIRQAAPLRVDHHYWLMAAEAFRRSRRLPAVADARYLLEPRQQAYPPFFGWLLSRLPPRWLHGSASVWLCQAADAAALSVSVLLGLSLGLGWKGALALFATVLLAPTLVAYNTQLNPRSFGNLFLVLMLAAEVAAATASGAAGWALSAVAIAAAAGIWLSHKMTTQLMLALWLPWALALGTPLAVAGPLLGLLLAGALAGPGPMLYQLAAHVDIVRFWSRHWPHLGLYSISQSPIYGDRVGDRSGAFHKPGWRGAVGHLRLVFGYAPILPLLPLLLVAGVDAPPWLVVWSLGTLAWALATALVPSLKGLGAGSLYVFFGVVPAGLWIGLAVETGHPFAHALLAVAMTVSVASLVLGWRQRQGRKSVEDGYAALLQRLRQGPVERIAVFPVTSSDALAADSPHRVLWGAHGYGFDLLEPIFPVVASPLSLTFARYRITRLVWNEAWWPDAVARLSGEMRIEGLETFGSWRTAAVSGLPQPPPIEICRLVCRRRAGTREPQSAGRDAGQGALARGRAGAAVLEVTSRRPVHLYRELRRLRPDVADCRGAGALALVIANLAGVPHRLASPPRTWLERQLAEGGLATVLEETPGIDPGEVYERCVSADVPAGDPGALRHA